MPFNTKLLCCVAKSQANHFRNMKNRNRTVDVCLFERLGLIAIQYRMTERAGSYNKISFRIDRLFKRFSRNIERFFLSNQKSMKAATTVFMLKRNSLSAKSLNQLVE